MTPAGVSMIYGSVVDIYRIGQDHKDLFSRTLEGTLKMRNRKLRDMKLRGRPSMESRECINILIRALDRLSVSLRIFESVAGIGEQQQERPQGFG